MNGICDRRTSIPILADRIFDNVRLDIDEPLDIFAEALPETATPMYAFGASTVGNAFETLSAVPSENSYDINGNILLPGVLTYMQNGIISSCPCRATVPLSFRLNAPESSSQPLMLTVDYSFYCDSFDRDDSSLSGLCSGTLISYLVCRMPVCVPFAGEMSYNPYSSRSTDSGDGFFSCDFYPSGEPINSVFKL